MRRSGRARIMAVVTVGLIGGGWKGDAARFGPQLERLCSQEIIGRHLPSLSARTWNCGKHDRGAVIARGVAFGEERWPGESLIA
jgi:hypothetical protein